MNRGYIHNQELPFIGILIDRLKAASDELAEGLSGGRNKRKKYIRFAVAALSSIPWVGGLLAASATLTSEKDQQHLNEFQRLRLMEDEKMAKELGFTIAHNFKGSQNFGDEIQKRIVSPEFLNLVRRCFRSWNEADTKEKKRMLQKLITNAWPLSYVLTIGSLVYCMD